MPHPFPLASVFSNGMRRDVDRTELPGGSAYNMVDFIPDEVQAVTAGRGGWTYAGPALTPITGTVAQIAYHPDLAKVYAFDGFGVYDVAAGGASLGTFKFSTAPMGYHRGRLFGGSWLSGGLAQQPYYLLDNGTIAQFASAPLAVYAGAYKDHALFARQKASGAQRTSTTNLNRIWFSAAGDPLTWDTTFGYWDTTGAITGIASTLNSILVFHGGLTERLRGTTPPPGSDMVLEPFFNDGCIDANSIAYWNERVVWASSRGIYLTDGATVVDLTATAQMKTYWSSLLSGYVSNTYHVVGGVYRDHYIVSVSNGSTLIDCLCVSLNDRTMWRFSNIKASSFANVTDSTSEKLYMGINNGTRVAELSSLWNPSAAVKNDADGTSPAPVVETGMFRGFDRLHRRWIESMGKQKWRWSYVDYDLRDAAADNPSATLSFCKTPTGAYTQAGLALPETTDISRVRRSLSLTQGGATHSQMLGLKYAVTGPYASAKLLTLEGVFEPIEIGAL